MSPQDMYDGTNCVTQIWFKHCPTGHTNGQRGQGEEEEAGWVGGGERGKRGLGDSYVSERAREGGVGGKREREREREKERGGGGGWEGGRERENTLTHNIYAGMYVHTCYVLTNPPIPYIPSSRCKHFINLRPVEILLHERGRPRVPPCKPLK
jgi:hypothetical protein